MEPKASTLFAVALAAGMFGACFGGAREEAPAPAGAAWTADIVGGGEIPTNGFATISVMGPSETRVNATLTHAAPDADHPWAVRQGRCVSPGERVGGEADYPRMRSTTAGVASATARLPTALEAEREYHLEVYAADGTTVIGCGDMR